MAKVKTTTLKANPNPQDISCNIGPGPAGNTVRVEVPGQLRGINVDEGHALIGKACVWASQLGIPMNEFMETILDMADAIDTFRLVEK